MSISTAPVMIASSCWRKLPATGMPWRMRISLAVQQMPARVTPSAPAALRFGDDLRVARGDGQHFRERRLMAVHEDVHRLRAQHARGWPGCAPARACRRECPRRWRPRASRPSRPPARCGRRAAAGCGNRGPPPCASGAGDSTTMRSMPEGSMPRLRQTPWRRTGASFKVASGSSCRLNSETKQIRQVERHRFLGRVRCSSMP